MKISIFISLLVLFAPSIGAGFAQNANIGDVEAFKASLETRWIHCTARRDRFL